MDIRTTTVQAFPADGGVSRAAKLIKRFCVRPPSRGVLSTWTPTLSGETRTQCLAISSLVLILAVLAVPPAEYAAQYYERVKAA
ncbi:MAG: hypothetical protein NTV05_16085 [Acidobacteria bacterium]|nr:hypothetical protein [Acidobacteriota bacterium]